MRSTRISRGPYKRAANMGRNDEPPFAKGAAVTVWEIGEGDRAETAALTIVLVRRAMDQFTSS
jgi:hypothetical protein